MHKIDISNLIQNLLFLFVNDWVRFKQARKSSEDTQVAGYARFEKVWAG